MLAHAARTDSQDTTLIAHAPSARLRPLLAHRPLLALRALTCTQTARTHALMRGRRVHAIVRASIRSCVFAFARACMLRSVLCAGVTFVVPVSAVRATLVCARWVLCPACTCVCL